jgi:biopolymer transport protein ExbD
MAGVDVGGGSGRRRTLDSEINMIPMIDLLMVTISFLLITAVWTRMSRVEADAQVPGSPHDEPRSIDPATQLHVMMRPDERFVLVWKQGSTTVDSMDVPGRGVIQREGSIEVVRFPDLAAAIEAEWKAKGQHAGPEDTRLDQAILHTDNGTEFKSMVGVIDAIHQTRRVMSLGRRLEKVPAFSVTFAVD